MREVNVKEAAQILGISRDAVRARLRRGTLEGEKVSGQWVVYLPDRQDTDRTRQDTDRPRQDTDRPDLEALVKSQQEQIAFLRQQLESREEEIRRRDHILNNITKQLPEPNREPEPDSKGLLQRIKEWLNL